MGKLSRLGVAALALVSVAAVADLSDPSAALGQRASAADPVVVSWSPTSSGAHGPERSTADDAAICPAPARVVVSARALAKLIGDCASAPYVPHVSRVAGRALEGARSPVGSAAAPTYYAPGGTYTDWYFPGASYDRLQWTFLPVADAPSSVSQQGFLHYYAYNFGLVNSSSDVGGGYAGLQTDGHFGGVQQGKVINFSIWGSNAAHTTSPLTGFNDECHCYQIMYKYSWRVNRRVRFELKRGPSGSDANGIWWGLWATDVATNSTTFIGEARVPSVIDGHPAKKWSNHTSVFGEDTHWWKALFGTTKYTNCKGFEPSSMAVLNVRSNGVTPSAMNMSTNNGRVETHDNFTTTSCAVTIVINNHHDVQHNLGYWPAKPASKLPAYPPVADAGPPTRPYPPQAFSTGRTATSLSWGPSTDDVAVVAYDVYRDGVKVGTTAGYQMVYRDKGLLPNTTYTYTVVARDIPKTVSDPSDPLEVTTTGP